MTCTSFESRPGSYRDRPSPPPNFTVKLMRPGFGAAAELPSPSLCDGVTPVADRVAMHQLNRGNRRAASGFGARNRPHSLP